jgi:hypothetical protein
MERKSKNEGLKDLWSGQVLLALNGFAEFAADSGWNFTRGHGLQ